MSSNLGKLFCSIINARLLDFITTHNVLSRSQIGFLPNYRTSDHIYTLHTLIEKHIHQDKGKIYACFIDFKKAFDSIWQQGLFYKLIESGIGGKTYDLSKSMYTESKCGVKINTKRTRYLSHERGVRQGTLTRYRLSGHKLMIETDRHRQTWLPPEQRLCSHGDLNQMETELHFLTECSKYTDIRTVFYDKIQQIHPTFTTLPDQEKLAYLLGEHKTCCVFAA